MTEPTKGVSSESKSLLTQEAAHLLRGILASGFPGWASLGVEQGRAAILQMKEFAGLPQPVSRFEQITLLDAKGLLYVPESSEPVPVLIYMHGGGWTLGEAAAVDCIARMLVNGSGCAVLSVDHRLAP